MALLQDESLQEATSHYGDRLYSVCDNVRGMESFLQKRNLITKEQLFENLDPQFFQDSNAWYTYRQYVQLMSNVSTYHKTLLNNQDYYEMGAHSIRTQNSFWYRYLSLLSIETLFREASRTSHKMQNAYSIRMSLKEPGRLDLILQDTPEFSQISFGNECHYFCGVTSALMNLNGLSRFRQDHTICGKSLLQLLKRQYAQAHFKIEEKSEGLYVDGKFLARRIPIAELAVRHPELSRHIKQSAWEICNDLIWNDKHLLRIGEIYNAPFCLIKIHYEPVHLLERLRQFFRNKETQSTQGLEEHIAFTKDKLDEAQAALMESQRKSKILRMYVRPSLVEQIDEGANPLDLEPEEVGMAILFQDIIGFTEMVESMSPQKVVEMLNRHFDNACSAILQHEGEVDKIIGDCIMAIFQSADQAVMAALALQKSVSENNELMQNRFGKQLQCGIGIHYGQVILGNVGGSQKLDYTIIGDAVNTASRIEALTRKYEASILVSHEVLQAMQNPQNVHATHLAEEVLRGKSTPTQLYSITIGEN